MRGGLAAAGTAIIAASCCLAIPVTVAITGMSGLAALGTNLGIAAVIASTMLLLSLTSKRSHGSGGGTDDHQG